MASVAGANLIFIADIQRIMWWYDWCLVWKCGNVGMWEGKWCADHVKPRKTWQAITSLKMWYQAAGGRHNGASFSPLRRAESWLLRAESWLHCGGAWPCAKYPLWTFNLRTFHSKALCATGRMPHALCLMLYALCPPRWMRLVPCALCLVRCAFTAPL